MISSNSARMAVFVSTVLPGERNFIIKSVADCLLKIENSKPEIGFYGFINDHYG